MVTIIIDTDCIQTREEDMVEVLRKEVTTTIEVNVLQIWLLK